MLGVLQKALFVAVRHSDDLEALVCQAESGRYVLRRTVAVQELAGAGCWPPAGAEAVCAFMFSGGSWYWEQRPERFIADRLLRQQISGPVLCRREGERTRLAVPFRRDRPVPLSGLFCLACVEQVEGHPHLVWSFDRAGNPMLPHRSGDPGQTKGSCGG